MRQKKHHKTVVLSLLSGMGALLSCNVALAAIMVIGNPNIHINHLNKNQLTKIYLGKPIQLSTDEQLRPLDQLDDAPINRKFYRVLLNWTPSQVSSYWSAVTFRGEGYAPTKVADDQNAIATVEGTRNAISYINSNALSIARGHVKVLHTFGRIDIKRATHKPKKHLVLKKRHHYYHSAPKPNSTPRPEKKQIHAVIRKPAVPVLKPVAKPKPAPRPKKKQIHPVIKKPAVPALKPVVKPKPAPRSKKKQVHPVIKKPATPSKASTKISQSLTTAQLNKELQLEQAKLAEQEVKAINVSLLLQHHSRVHHSHPSKAMTQNLWSTIVAHFAIANTGYQPAVQQQIAWYLNHKAALEAILNNAVPYIDYVYKQTQARGMPAEFALLPMLESGYNPLAYSAVGATGIWQMMPGTASSLGLDINWWYDARRDTLASTQVALNYLKSLHNTFHDWLLATAAYNGGVGTVKAAQQYNRQHNDDTQFWNLPLPNETKGYVPKLLALATIIENPSHYGVTLPNIPDRPYFSAIRMKAQIELAKVARLAGVSPKLIRRLNSGMRRWVTKPGSACTLLIPYNKIKVFKSNLAKVDGKERVSWQYHEVRNGETLKIIAKNYHTRVAFLERINGLKGKQIVPEQGILVPLHLHERYSASNVDLNNASEAQPITLPQHSTTMPLAGDYASQQKQPQTQWAKSRSNKATSKTGKETPASRNLQHLLTKMYGTSKD